MDIREELEDLRNQLQEVISNCKKVKVAFPEACSAPRIILETKIFCYSEFINSITKLLDYEEIPREELGLLLLRFQTVGGC